MSIDQLRVWGINAKWVPKRNGKSCLRQAQDYLSSPFKLENYRQSLLLICLHKSEISWCYYVKWLIQTSHAQEISLDWYLILIQSEQADLKYRILIVYHINLKIVSIRKVHDLKTILAAIDSKLKCKWLRTSCKRYVLFNVRLSWF